ncbi:MAG: GNAT family N-acetyltransferase [Candidatus Omnitrophica bacterium]|nr:GNAT family N-acetyltransferase [Candidatus Omnitrophota bacterium]
MPEIQIRKFDLKDRSEVRRISCETSFLEEDRGLFIEDDEILSDALTLYYTDYEPESCFVAVNRDRVVGYVIGTKDANRMEKVFFKQILLKFIKKAFCKHLFIKVKTWRLFFYISMSALKGEFNAPHFSAQYPAMLHINVDKDYRGCQIGKSLIGHYMNYLKEQGISGVYFGTISNEAKAFFSKLGFKLLYESKRSYLRYQTGKILPFYILGKSLGQAV